MARTMTILAAALLTTAAPAMAQSAGGGAQAGASTQAQAGGVSAQTSANAAASANASQEGSLAAGTALSAQLDQTVDSKKAKPGDAVTAKTVDAIKANGKTILPKGTKLVGHVTKATAKSKGDAESMLAVQFDHAILKGGQEIPLQASVQALAAAQSVTSATVGGDDLQPAGPTGGGVSGGGGRAGGAVGGATNAAGSAVGGAAGTVGRTAGEATGAVNSTVGGAANASRGGTGLGAGGQLVATSRGVFGLEGLALGANASNSEEGSVITSTGKNVHLDSGTRMLLVTQSATSVSAQR